MLSKDMLALGTRRSVIREIFEFGKKRAAEVGPENVFDFSIGNPSIPAPECVKKAILELLDNEDPCVLHGYTSAQGDPRARRAIADYVNKTHGVALSPDDIYMTCGAAASPPPPCPAGCSRSTWVRGRRVPSWISRTRPTPWPVRSAPCAKSSRVG